MKELTNLDIQQVSGGAISSAILYPAVGVAVGAFNSLMDNEGYCVKKTLSEQISCSTGLFLQGVANGAKVGITAAWVSSLYDVYHQVPTASM